MLQAYRQDFIISLIKAPMGGSSQPASSLSHPPPFGLPRPPALPRSRAQGRFLRGDRLGLGLRGLGRRGLRRRSSRSGWRLRAMRRPFRRSAHDGRGLRQPELHGGLHARARHLVPGKDHAPGAGHTAPTMALLPRSHTWGTWGHMPYRWPCHPEAIASKWRRSWGSGCRAALAVAASRAASLDVSAT